MVAREDAVRWKWVVAAGVGGAGVLGTIAGTLLFATPVEKPALVRATATAAGAAPSRTVVVRVESDPAGADVLLDGEVTTKTPGQVLLDRGDAPVDLLFRISGRVPAVERVIPDRDRTLRPTLRRPELPARPAPPG